ncbi:unnamed protein product [Discosporangium mesarthrocarpum]
MAPPLLRTPPSFPFTLPLHFSLQLMHKAGIPPTFAHLRIICTKTEPDFSVWILKMIKGAQHASANGRPARASPAGPHGLPPHPKALSPPQPGSKTVKLTQGRPLRVTQNDDLHGVPGARRVGICKVAELGISYRVVEADLGGWPSAPSPRAPRVVSEGGDGSGLGLGLGVGVGEAFWPGRKDARALVREVGQGLRVLDLHCGTGGFALNAAKGGANSVLGVDRLDRVIRVAKANVKENKLGDVVSFEKKPALSFVHDAAARGEVWDLVVLDPPMSRGTKGGNLTPLTRGRRINKYMKLVEASLSIIRPGGMLLALESSGQVLSSQQLFTSERAMIAAISAAAQYSTGWCVTPLTMGSNEGELSSSIVRQSLIENDLSPPGSISVEKGGSGSRSRDEGNREGKDSEKEGVDWPNPPLWVLFICSPHPVLHR